MIRGCVPCFWRSVCGVFVVIVRGSLVLDGTYCKSKVGLLYQPHMKQGNNYLLRTVLVHGRLETLVESARSTLVAVCFVDRTASLQVAGRFARIYSVTVNTSLEEPRTTYKTMK